MNYGYFLIMLAAIVAGFAVARFTQTGLGLRAGQKFGIALGGFIGAMVGAKLPFLFIDWDQFLAGSAWFSSGKTVLTGLVGGYFGVELAKWSLDIRTRTGDSFVVPVAIAIAIGRVGCFYAGCCYGLPTELPWGVVFTAVDNVPRHPTQIYESLFHLGAAGMAFWLARRGLFSGQRIKLYIIAYAVYRFLTEALRPEEPLYFGLTGYQIASLVIISLFAWLWARDSRRFKRNHAEESSVT